MANETSYTVVYKALADFSALTREAAKAKTILKSLREEEEKMNKSALDGQQRVERARIRATKALEAQNMAATVSARISREMTERGKKEAETVKEIGTQSNAAARHITRLAEAYKKLNSASSGATTSSYRKGMFGGVNAEEIEKLQKNVKTYTTAASQSTTTNERLGSSLNNLLGLVRESGSVIADLSAAQRRNASSTNEVTVTTRRLGDTIETTTRRVINAGTEAEKVTTTIRRVTKEVDGFGNGISGWIRGILSNMRTTWQEAEQGISVFSKLRRSIASGNGEGNFLSNLSRGFTAAGETARGFISTLARLPRAIQLAVGVAAIFEPVVAILGSLGAAALGAANNVVVLAGALAAVPGFVAAGATAMAALLVASAPVVGIFKQYAKAQQEAETATKSSGAAQTDNSDRIRTASRSVRSAMESLADANRSVTRAQESLSDAWRDAKKDLEELREEVERGTLNEERALINLERAQERYNKTMSDRKASGLDRRDAALDVKEAEQALEDVRKRNKENQEELEAAEKRGIANSEQVKRARENLSDAERRAANASLDLADAKLRLAQAHVVEVAEVRKTTTQQDRYQKMLSQTGTKTKEFITFVLGLSDAWKGIQKNTSEAFFNQLSGGLNDAKTLLPVVENLLVRSADALGKVALRGIEMISSGPWKKDFSVLAEENAVLIENIGDATLSVADGFRHITMAAVPFTRWVSEAIKSASADFAAWADRARADGSIQRFLEETKSRMQAMWQITKNLISTLSSWNTASNDFGRWILERLKAVTDRWREVAKAQEAAGSPLRNYLEDIKPLLSALGSLLGAVAAGFAAIAADPQNIQNSVRLLTTLEKEVLPPLLDLLNKLNESGISITVAEAIGSIFEALANFLEVGGAQAIKTFVTVFAGFVDLVLTIASLPVVGDVLGGLAVGLAAVAAVSVAARFLGLFKLIELFKWVRDNGKSVASRFTDIGNSIDGVGNDRTPPPAAGGGTTRPPASGPSASPGFSRLSSSELGEVTKNINAYTTAAGTATTRTGRFSRSMDVLRNSAQQAGRGMRGFTDFLGGPWGVALTAATIGIGLFMAEQQKVNDKADSYRAALDNISGGYDEVSGSARGLSAEAVRADPVLAEMINTLSGLGLSAKTIEEAFSGSGPAVSEAMGAIEKAMEDASLEVEKNHTFLGEWNWIADKTFNKDNIERLKSLEALKEALKNKKISTEDAAKAMAAMGLTEERTAEKIETVTKATLDQAAVQSTASEKIRSVEQILATLGDTTATVTQRYQALQEATELLYGSTIDNNEATENYHRKLNDLRRSVEENGTTISDFSDASLNNRDALQAAALAVRDNTLQLIASGTPYEDAIKLHKERIAEIIKEADELGYNKKQTEELIRAYHQIPGEKRTDIKSSGFAKVYQELRELQFAQLALKNGLSPAEAEAQWRRMEAARKGDYPQGGGSAGLPKRAYGGPIYGAGSKTSDDIDAKLSHGEFVQQAAAVDYYGTDLMYALNSRMIDKSTLKAAADMSARKQSAEHLDPIYSQGGHVLRLAAGGVALPFPVSLNGVVSASQKLYNDWKKNFQIIGGGDGSIGGWQNMWKWVKARFPFVSLMSGYRPGDPLYHGKGKAVDLGVPDKWGTGRWWDVFRGIKSTFFKNIAELIWDFAGNKAVWNGEEHFFNGPKSGPGTHRDHIHWAMKNPNQAFNAGKATGFADGGLVDTLASLRNFSGLPSGMSSLPSRDLFPAARAVTDHGSSARGPLFGDITINNPVAERGGDSIRRSIQRTVMLFDEPY